MLRLRVVSVSALLVVAIAAGLRGQEATPKPRLDQYGKELPERAIARRKGPRFIGGFGNICFCDPGQSIVSPDEVFSLQRWSITDGRIVAKFDRENLNWHLVTQNCRFAVTSEIGANRNYNLIDTQSKRIGPRFGKGDDRPSAITPDGRVVVTTMANAGVRMWDTATGTMLGESLKTAHPQHSALSPDGKMFFAGEFRDSIRLYSIPNATVKRTLFGFSDIFGGNIPLVFPAMCVSPDNRRLGVGSMHAVRIFEINSGSECSAVQVHGSQIYTQDILRISSDGHWMATATNTTKGQFLTLWNARTGKLIKTWPAGPSRLELMEFSPDSKYIVTAGQDYFVWDVSDLLTKPTDAPLSAAEQQKLWDALAGDGPTSFAAIGKWIDSPTAAIAYLKDATQPAKASDAQKVAQLFADLDSPTFAKRDKANRELRNIGASVVGPLKTCLTDKVSAEARQRAESIIASFDGEFNQLDRALEVLEAIATPEARAILSSLAKGVPGARLTEAAQAGLQRLEARPK